MSVEVANGGDNGKACLHRFSGGERKCGDHIERISLHFWEGKTRKTARMPFDFLLQGARSFVYMCVYKLLAAMQGCRWRRCCCELAKLAAAGAAAATVGSLCTAAANAADATNIATQWFWLAERLRWLDLVNWLVRRLLGCLVGWPRSCVRLLPEYKQFVRQLRNGRFVVADKRVMARVAIFWRVYVKCANGILF